MAIDREAAKAAGYTDAEIDAFEHTQLAQAAAAPEEPGTDWNRVGWQTAGGIVGGGIGLAGSAPTGMTAAPIAVPVMAAAGSQLAGSGYDVLQQALAADDEQLPQRDWIDYGTDFAIDAVIGPLLGSIAKPLARPAAQLARATLGPPAEYLGHLARTGYRGAVEGGTRLIESVAGTGGGIARAEGVRLAGRYPEIAFTPGQQSASPARLSQENYLRQNAGSADIMAELDRANVGALQERVATTAARTGGARTTESALGARLQDQTEASAENLRQFAGNSWRQLTQPLEDAGVRIRPEQTVRELDVMIAEQRAIPSDKAQAAANELERIRDRMMTGGQPAFAGGADEFGNILPPRPATPAEVGEMPFNDWRQLRTEYARASRSNDNIFQDIADAGDLSRRVSGRLVGALERDMDSVGNGIPADLRPFYDTARTTYRRTMSSIERLDASPLGKQLGDSLEDFAYGTGEARTKAGSAIVRTLMNPKIDLHELQYVARVIGDGDPQLLRDLQRYAIDNALETAGRMPPSGGIVRPPLSTSRLVSAMPDPERLSALGVEPQAIREIGDLMNAAVRLGDRTGFNFSGTNVARESGDIIGGAATLAKGATGAVGNILNVLAKAVGARDSAMALLNPQMRARMQAIMANQQQMQQLLNAAQGPSPLRRFAEGTGRVVGTVAAQRAGGGAVRGYLEED